MKYRNKNRKDEVSKCEIMNEKSGIESASDQTGEEGRIEIMWDTEGVVPESVLRWKRKRVSEWPLLILKHVGISLPNLN